MRRYFALLSFGRLRHRPGTRDIETITWITEKVGNMTSNGLRALFALAVVVLSMSVHGYTEVPIDHGTSTESLPARGINTSFGRWVNEIPIAYNPSGAPPVFSDDAVVVTAIKRALGIWERVCGVRFKLAISPQPVTDDGDRPVAERDGIVSITWRDADGWAGQAGPGFNTYSQSLGYRPYFDGSIELNSDETIWGEGTDYLVNVLVHEIGHLLGLGHSNDPLSVMFANPYNNLSYPRPDDIRAVQAIYGSGTSRINPYVSVSDWKYVPPKLASVDFMNANFVNGAASLYLAFSNATNVRVRKVTSATVDGLSLRGIAGNLKSGANFNARLILVDPGGYVWGNYFIGTDCGRFNSCNRFLPLISSDSLKTVAGTWRVYFVDQHTDASSSSLLETIDVVVESDAPANRPPVASVSVTAGSTPNSVKVTLSPYDEEDSEIEVSWHVPGSMRDYDGDKALDSALVEWIPSGSERTHEFQLPGVGKFDLYIALKDKSSTYRTTTAISGPEGRGFSNILHAVVRLPLTAVPGSVFVQAAHDLYDPQEKNAETARLLKIASQKQSIGMTTGFEVAATFSLGVASDNGAQPSAVFSSDDALEAAGTISTNVNDHYLSGELYVVVHHLTSTLGKYYFKEADGTLQPWNGALGTLRPFRTTTALRPTELVELLGGKLDPGKYTLYLGYKGYTGVLHYSAQPLQFTVADGP